MTGKAKLVQSDKRGQIVIPKNIRGRLKIEDGSAFWIHSIDDDTIILKKVRESFDEKEVIAGIKAKSGK